MKPLNFYFDVRDIFRAPRLALSGKKILIFLKANLIGFAVYWVFTYLSLFLNGNNLTESIHNFGLYPCIFTIENVSYLSYLVYSIGLIYWILQIYFSCTAVSRITIKQLRGIDEYSIRDSLDFVKEYRIPIFMSWISILLIVAFFMIGSTVFALLGKIPWIGEILFALLYVIFFFGAIFTIYTLIALVISLIYSPSIVATMEEDTMGTVFQSYTITWSQPWRIILYNIVLLPLFGIGIYILKWFWIAGYKFINSLFGMDWLMSNKLRNIVGWASDLVNPCVLFCSNIYYCRNGTFLTISNDAMLSTTEYLAGTVLAIILFVLMMIIFSYGLSILSVGETIILTILKKKSNDENLLERDDRDSLIENDINDNKEDNSIEKTS